MIPRCSEPFLGGGSFGPWFGASLGIQASHRCVRFLAEGAREVAGPHAGALVPGFMDIL